MDKPTIDNSEAEPTANTQQPAEGVKQGLGQEAGEIVLKPFTRNLVIVTTTSNGLLKLELKQLFANYHLVAAANGKVGVSSQRHFYIWVSTCLPRAEHLPNYIVIAQIAELPMVIHAIYPKPRRGCRLWTLEKHSQVHAIPGENATSEILIADDIAEVQYEPT